MDYKEYTKMLLDKGANLDFEVYTKKYLDGELDFNRINFLISQIDASTKSVEKYGENQSYLSEKFEQKQKESKENFRNSEIELINDYKKLVELSISGVNKDFETDFKEAVMGLNTYISYDNLVAYEKVTKAQNDKKEALEVLEKEKILTDIDKRIESLNEQIKNINNYNISDDKKYKPIGDCVNQIKLLNNEKNKINQEIGIAKQTISEADAIINNNKLPNTLIKYEMGFNQAFNRLTNVSSRLPLEENVKENVANLLVSIRNKYGALSVHDANPLNDLNKEANNAFDEKQIASAELLRNNSEIINNGYIKELKENYGISYGKVYEIPTIEKAEKVSENTEKLILDNELTNEPKPVDLPKEKPEIIPMSEPIINNDIPVQNNNTEVPVNNEIAPQNNPTPVTRHEVSNKQYKVFGSKRSTRAVLYTAVATVGLPVLFGTPVIGAATIGAVLGALRYTNSVDGLSEKISNRLKKFIGKFKKEHFELTEDYGTDIDRVLAENDAQDILNPRSNIR